MKYNVLILILETSVIIQRSSVKEIFELIFFPPTDSLGEWERDKHGWSFAK